MLVEAYLQYEPPTQIIVEDDQQVNFLDVVSNLPHVAKQTLKMPSTWPGGTNE